jgi:hypothetical protein
MSRRRNAALDARPERRWKADGHENKRETEDEIAIGVRAQGGKRRIDRKRKPKSKRKSAMQAGARRYPALPLPTQNLAKPGREAALKLAPMSDAQHYLGSRKLEGMAALITAADSSIDRAVADFRRFGRSMHSISSGF